VRQIGWISWWFTEEAKMETGVLILFEGNPIFHLPPGRSLGYLPDSPDLWQAMWDNREGIWGFAHSHPGNGVPAPSMEDLTTFAAVEAALGERIQWWITSEDTLVVCNHAGPGRLDYRVDLMTEEDLDKLADRNSGPGGHNKAAGLGRRLRGAIHKLRELSI
jgi:hypothetical protein